MQNTETGNPNLVDITPIIRSLEDEGLRKMIPQFMEMYEQLSAIGANPSLDALRSKSVLDLQMLGKIPSHDILCVKATVLSQISEEEQQRMAEEEKTAEWESTRAKAVAATIPAGLPLSKDSSGRYKDVFARLATIGDDVAPHWTEPVQRLVKSTVFQPQFQQVTVNVSLSPDELNNLRNRVRFNIWNSLPEKP